MSRTVVLIPTYDERESLPRILERLHAANPDADALVIDDASPDGTGPLADELAAADARIHVLHRTEKAGLGAAYVAGFAWALERGYDRIVEMDADGSHPPETLPAMLARSDEGHGLVIGSRWVRGGSVVDWPRRREVLSRGANAYARVVLGGGVHDMTAGYRVYTAELLRALPLDGVAARGYAFQIEMTLLAFDAGASVAEVPIVFREREVGVSKMSGSIIGEAFTKVAGWGVGRRSRQLRDVLRR